MTVLLLIAAGTTVFLISPVSAEKPVVTIAAHGDASYYLGEEAVFTGVNTGSDTTYLYITGPVTFTNGPGIPESGGKLTSPLQKVVGGDPESFIAVKTKPDTTWEYSWYTSGLKLEAGTYTVYAAGQPKAADQLAEAPYGTTGIIVKKPFIAAEISPSSVSQGKPFTVTGTAEGIPDKVQVWIFGDNYVFTTKIPVNPDASFAFSGDTAMAKKLPAGQNWLVVQHPMQNNKFDIDVSGDYVRNLNLNNGTNLFRITGPGSLQGRDAAEALVAAFGENEVPHDTTVDTYTIIPFQVTGAGSPTSSGTPAATTVPASGASAGTGVTISADGDKSYYLGEQVVFRGQNTDSDSTYLFIRGPGTFVSGPGIPDGGGKLTSPLQKVVSDTPDSFTVVRTKPDKTWEYSYYTANLPLDAGTYSIYAASQPKTADQLGPDAASVGIIVKKPFLTAELSSPEVVKGQPFTVNGTAEGIPPEVQIWIIGDAYATTTTTPVNPGDASFAFTADAALSGALPAGQNWLVVQHPMADNQFDFVVSGDSVRNLKQGGGTDLFKITGPGGLQGSDAAKALITAISDQETLDKMSTSDTYTIIPFRVVDAGGASSQTPAATTAPVSQHIPLQYAAPIGAGVLVIAGIVLWKRY
jgi:hypothetical protein